MGASFANELVRKHSIEQILHHFLFLGAFDKVFYPIDEHIKEFVYVPLDHWVDRRTVNVLKSKAELFGIKVLLFQFL